MQTIYIVSSGSFYRPIDTPMGKYGWVGEITFWFPPTFEGPKIPNISMVFGTQEEADEFVNKKLFELFHEEKYRFRDYDARRLPPPQSVV